MARSGCASDADCPGLRCLKISGERYGECSGGKLGEACNGAGDCDAKLACFTSRQDDFRFKVAGRCLSEPTGKACSYDEDCGAGHCIGGFCSSGRKGSACLSDQQCAFGVCTNFAIEALAFCSNGEPGAWCKKDADCTQGACTFVAKESFGLCSDGRKGKACIGDRDCASHKCGNAGTSIEVGCRRFGEVCGVHREGVCDADFHCQYGRCD